MEQEGLSLAELHHRVIVSLVTAIGNLRLLAVGAPFGSELIQLVENDLQAALAAAQSAEEKRAGRHRSKNLP